MGLKLPDEAKKPVSDNPVSRDLAENRVSKLG
jgi:hypothetical protein